MKIWINSAKPFEAAVITRFLYYATNFENLEIYITNFNEKHLSSFVRYSRIPISEIKNRIKFNEVPKGKFLIIDPNGENLENININDFDGFVIDFENKMEGKKVRGIGLNLLHYEAIAVFSKIFLKDEKPNLEELQNEKEYFKEKIYLAKKILEGLIFLDNFYIISPRLLSLSLQHLHKKFKILIEEVSSEIKKEKNSVIEIVNLAFYNKRLEKIKEDSIVLKNNILEVPIFNGKETKRLKFLIDFDRRRIYISKDFFISTEDINKEKLLGEFFDLE
ncbi:MAG: hypothetical protein QW197_03065 [Candidatus Aenigmatarchaeota archaeon]